MSVKEKQILDGMRDWLLRHNNGATSHVGFDSLSLSGNGEDLPLAVISNIYGDTQNLLLLAKKVSAKTLDKASRMLFHWSKKDSRHSYNILFNNGDGTGPYGRLNTKTPGLVDRVERFKAKYKHSGDAWDNYLGRIVALTKPEMEVFKRLKGSFTYYLPHTGELAGGTVETQHMRKVKPTSNFKAQPMHYIPDHILFHKGYLEGIRPFETSEETSVKVIDPRKR